MKIELNGTIPNFARIINIVLAIVWGFYGVMFIIGNYVPSGFMIGAMLFMLALENVMEAIKK